MNGLQQHIINRFTKHRWYGVTLGLTLLYFLYKGLSYVVIGSYVPLLLIVVVLSLFVFSSYTSEKAFRRTISLWAILIMIWSCVRLLLTLVNQFLKPIPEGHVDGQLGILGALLSLLFLVGGIYLLRHKKRVFKKAG